MSSTAIFCATLIINRPIQTKHAVTSLQSLAVRTTQVEIPVSVTNTDNWIRENFEKLLRIPVALSEISYSYEILGRKESANTVEVTFARKSEIEQTKHLFSEAGLTLLSLTAGTRDSLNVLVYSELFQKNDISSFVYFSDAAIVMNEFSNKKRVRTFTIDKMDENLISNNDLIFSGAVPATITSSVIKPLGVASEYTLAVGHALKGFLPEFHALNLFEQKEVEKIQLESFLLSLKYGQL